MDFTKIEHVEQIVKDHSINISELPNDEVTISEPDNDEEDTSASKFKIIF